MSEKISKFLRSHKVTKDVYETLKFYDEHPGLFTLRLLDMGDGSKYLHINLTKRGMKHYGKKEVDDFGGLMIVPNPENEEILVVDGDFSTGYKGIDNFFRGIH